MRTASMVVGVVAALAMIGSALAGEPGARRPGKERAKATRETGRFVSATLDGETIQWKLTVDEAGVEKTFQMPAEVVVLSRERRGQKRVLSIFGKGKKVPEGKGKRQVATGTFVRAAVEGARVALTIKVGEEEQTFSLPTKLAVTYREKGGVLHALRIGAGPRERKGKEGAERPRKARGRKKGGEEGAPDNM